jgi:hypothetical protein
VRAQKVRWNRGSAELAQHCTSFHGKQNESRELGTGLFIYKGRISALNRGAGKSLAPPGRKQARATEDFDVHISYL